MTFFIDEYVECASELTDAPAIYHKAVGLVLLSAVVGRKPILITPKPLYPNLWVMLVGRSGLERKSSAQGIGYDLLDDKRIKILSSEFTPEGLVKELAKASSGIKIKDELGGFLASSNREYMSGVKDLLSLLYDCPDYYPRRLSNEMIELHDVYLVMLTGTTQTTLMLNMRRQDFEGGFGCRWLYVLATREQRKPRRNLSITDTTKRTELRSWLSHTFDVFKNDVRFKLDDESLQIYNQWEEQLEIRIKQEEDPDLMGSIYTRLADYAIKVSALIEVADMPRPITLPEAQIDSTTNSPFHYISISPNSMKKAIEFIEDILQGTRELVKLGNQSELY